MKTFLLIGLAKNGGFVFPKPLCTVRAVNITEAAAQLGGHLHDAGTHDRQPFTAIFMPDMECAVFHGGAELGIKIGEAIFGALGGPPSPADADMLRRGMQHQLGFFSKLLLGQMPSIG